MTPDMMVPVLAFAVVVCLVFGGWISLAARADVRRRNPPRKSAGEGRLSVWTYWQDGAPHVVSYWTADNALGASYRAFLLGTAGTETLKLPDGRVLAHPAWWGQDGPDELSAAWEAWSETHQDEVNAWLVERDVAETARPTSEMVT